MFKPNDSNNSNDLKQIHEALIRRYRFSEEQSAEVIQAYLNVQSAIDDVQNGKTVAISETLARNHALLRRIANIMYSSPNAGALNKLIMLYNLMSNGASAEVIEAVQNAPASSASISLKPNIPNDLPELEVKTDFPNHGITKATNRALAAEHRYELERIQALQDQAQAKQAELDAFIQETFEWMNRLKQESSLQFMPTAESTPNNTNTPMEEANMKKSLVGLALVSAVSTAACDTKTEPVQEPSTETANDDKGWSEAVNFINLIKVLGGYSNPKNHSGAFKHIQMEENPNPQKPYLATVVIENSPVDFEDSAEMVVGYTIKGNDDRNQCLPEVDNFNGIQYAPDGELLTLSAKQENKHIFTGVFYADAILDKDYYGLGVCQFEPEVISMKITLKNPPHPIPRFFRVHGNLGKHINEPNIQYFEYDSLEHPEKGGVDFETGLITDLPIQAPKDPKRNFTTAFSIKEMK